MMQKWERHHKGTEENSDAATLSSLPYTRAYVLNGWRQKLLFLKTGFRWSHLLALLFNLYFHLLFIMQNNLFIFYSAEHLISVKLYLLACVTALCLVCGQYKIFQRIHNSDWLQRRKLLKSQTLSQHVDRIDGSRAFSYTKLQVNLAFDGMPC